MTLYPLLHPILSLFEGGRPKIICLQRFIVSPLIINMESLTQYITHPSGSLKIGFSKRHDISVALRMLRCPAENLIYLSASEYYDL